MRHLSDKKILDILRCPICGEDFELIDGKTLACNGKKRHCYDMAASGYVNLASPVQSGGGDSKEAVRARREFLDLGYYRSVSEELARICAEHKSTDDILLDAGCGEGYYTGYLCKKGFSTIGVDISKFAVDSAAKRLARDENENFFFMAASVFALPVKTGSVDILTNVFAPCAEAEYARVLKNDGVLVVVWAGERHLLGLKEAIYDSTHINTVRADLPESMQLIDTSRVRYTATIEGREQIKALFAMTPYYWRTSKEDAHKLDKLDTLTTEIDIMISVYKKEDLE